MSNKGFYSCPCAVLLIKLSSCILAVHPSCISNKSIAGADSLVEAPNLYSNEATIKNGIILHWEMIDFGCC